MIVFVNDYHLEIKTKEQVSILITKQTKKNFSNGKSFKRDSGEVRLERRPLAIPVSLKLRLIPQLALSNPLRSYPYTADKSIDESSKQKKKLNPYSIGLIEDTHQNSESSPSGIGMSDEVLSSLFACKQNLANQKFELKINDIRFVSHPALMENKNSFILINIVFALQAQCSYSIGERCEIIFLF